MQFRGHLWYLKVTVRSNRYLGAPLEVALGQLAPPERHVQEVANWLFAPGNDTSVRKDEGFAKTTKPDVEPAKERTSQNLAGGTALALVIQGWDDEFQPAQNARNSITCRPRWVLRGFSTWATRC